MKFLPWILENTADQLDEVRKYVLVNPNNWINTPDIFSAISQIHQDQSIDTATRTMLVDSLRNFININGDKRGKRQLLDTWIPTICVALVATIAIGVLVIVLLPPEWNGILDNLADPSTARGMITFVFAFGVMFIAIMLLISLFSSQDPNISDKFDRAKELFTALIAVLGTIMGFYFGIQQEGGNAQPEEVVIARLNLLGMTDVTDIPNDLVDDVAAILSGVLTEQQKVEAVRSLLETRAAAQASAAAGDEDRGNNLPNQDPNQTGDNVTDRLAAIGLVGVTIPDDRLQEVLRVLDDPAPSDQEKVVAIQGILSETGQPAGDGQQDGQ